MNPFIWFHDDNNQLVMINALEIIKVFSTSSYSHGQVTVIRTRDGKETELKRETVADIQAKVDKALQ